MNLIEYTINIDTDEYTSDEKYNKITSNKPTQSKRGNGRKELQIHNNNRILHNICICVATEYIIALAPKALFH